MSTTSFRRALVVRNYAASPPACPTQQQHPTWSVARRWDEALLDAIRRAVPAPTVHARNLFHLSAAMWDAWAAYDPHALGYFVSEKDTAHDVAAARNETISYAAYRLLTARYINAVGADASLSEFDDVMDSLCYALTLTSTDGDSPAALGNRIAEAAIAYGLSDGSNQADGYSAPDYAPRNPPLVVAQPGTTMLDPDRWQPLQLEHMISQNGIPVENGVQQFVGPQWGGVKGFALPAADARKLPIDPGPQPHSGDPEFGRQALEVVRDSAALDTSTGRLIDIAPDAMGANDLGTNNGHGRALNPVSGQPYAPDVVNEGEFARVLAEFWADGPNSETPPGHWNVIANGLSDAVGSDLRMGGSGPGLDRLEWDVKLYFALNGALHDAAIAAWGAKGYYDSSRPISMIRYLGGLRQLPLEPGLVEEITPQTTLPAGPHAALAGHEGEVAVRAWRPGGAGVGWERAVEWLPYQAPTFVTPSFAGSGVR